MANATADSVGQERLLEVWQQHCYSEFVMKDAKGALTTMSDNPHVSMVPIATGDELLSPFHDGSSDSNPISAPL
ncbi:MAG: hypothetical protein JWO91_3411 [Acidobacteriaceae bacterium]|nr:hypothetical protein [Acidobacteriaceae bacterium]